MHPVIGRGHYTYDHKNYSGTPTAQELVAAPGAGKRIYIHHFKITLGAAGTYQLFEDTDAIDNYIDHGDAAENGGVLREWPFEGPWPMAENKPLKVTASQAAKVRVEYVIGPAD